MLLILQCMYFSYILRSQNTQYIGNHIVCELVFKPYDLVYAEYIYIHIYIPSSLALFKDQLILSLKSAYLRLSIGIS